jgi:hypothetical protein
MRQLKPGQLAFLAVGLLFTSVAPAAAQNGSQTSSTSVPGLGALIMWYVCAKRKAQEIGGWLLYFYIQLYIGVIISLLVGLAAYENYLPSTWVENQSLYPLFLLSAVPGIVILPIQLVVAERLRKSRDVRFVRSLRTVLWVQLAAAVVGAVIDYAQFPDNLPLDVLAVIWPSVWLPYFHMSKRVKRVFETKNWVQMVPVVTQA